MVSDSVIKLISQCGDWEICGDRMWKSVSEHIFFLENTDSCSTFAIDFQTCFKVFSFTTRSVVWHHIGFNTECEQYGLVCHTNFLYCLPFTWIVFMNLTCFTYKYSVKRRKKTVIFLPYLFEIFSFLSYITRTYKNFIFTGALLNYNIFLSDVRSLNSVYVFEVGSVWHIFNI